MRGVATGAPIGCAPVGSFYCITCWLVLARDTLESEVPSSVIVSCSRAPLPPDTKYENRPQECYCYLLTSLEIPDSRYRQQIFCPLWSIAEYLVCFQGNTQERGGCFLEGHVYRGFLSKSIRVRGGGGPYCNTNLMICTTIVRYASILRTPREAFNQR